MLCGMSKLMIPPAKLEHFIMVNRVKSDRLELDIEQAVTAAIGSTATRDEMRIVANLGSPDKNPVEPGPKAVDFQVGHGSCVRQYSDS